MINLSNLIQRLIGRDDIKFGNGIFIDFSGKAHREVNASDIPFAQDANKNVGDLFWK